MFIHRENAMRRPSTYIILFSTKRSLLKNNFNTRYDQNIYHGASNCTFFKKISRGVACPLALVQLISLFLYENNHFFVLNAIKIYTKTHQL